MAVTNELYICCVEPNDDKEYVYLLYRNSTLKENNIHDKDIIRISFPISMCSHACFRNCFFPRWESEIKKIIGDNDIQNEFWGSCDRIEELCKHYLAIHQVNNTLDYANLSLHEYCGEKIYFSFRNSLKSLSNTEYLDFACIHHDREEFLKNTTIIAV